MATTHKQEIQEAEEDGQEFEIRVWVMNNESES